MKRASKILLLSTLVFAAAAVFAQGPPSPSPEVKKLDYFVGTWAIEGDFKPGPMGPGGKFTGTDHIEWMDGGFFIVLHSDINMPDPMGKMKTLAVMGYDSDAKKYTYNEFNSMGETDKSLGMVNGDEWSWTSDIKMGDMTMKGHFTEKVLSPTSYTFKFEMSPDGASWTTVMEGKATKK